MPNVIWFHRPEHNGNLRQGDELDAVIGQVSNCQVGPFITPFRIDKRAIRLSVLIMPSSRWISRRAG